MLACRRLVPLLLAAFLAACEDSTGPGISASFLAGRFEALARTRTEAGDGNGAAAARGAALALRLGVRPARVTISVDGVSEEYLAFETEYAYGEDDGAGPLPPIPIVVRTMIAWRGLQPDRFLAMTVPGDTGTFAPPCIVCLTVPSNQVGWLLSYGVFVQRGRPPLIAVAGGARTTRQSLGAECEVPKRPAFVPGLDPIACHRAIFFARFTMTANESNTTSSATLSHVLQMSGHDVPGVRLLYPPLPTL